MINNGCLTWHQRNHGILFCFHLNTLHHHHHHHDPNIWTIKQKDSGTWCDTLSARLGFLYRFYWKHSKVKNISIWEMRTESLKIPHHWRTWFQNNIMCKRLTFLYIYSFFDLCRRYCCCSVIFFFVILFIRLVWAMLWLWIVTRPPLRTHSLWWLYISLKHWTTCNAIESLHQIEFPCSPIRVRIVCALVFRLHSLKYYIFTLEI